MGAQNQRARGAAPKLVVFLLVFLLVSLSHQPQGAPSKKAHHKGAVLVYFFVLEATERSKGQPEAGGTASTRGVQLGWGGTRGAAWVLGS